MKAIRTVTWVGMLFGGSLMLPACTQQAGVGQTNRANAHMASASQPAPIREIVTVAADEPIPNVPGKRLVSRVVHYPPGARSIPHRHAGSAFIYAYVLSGAVRSAVDDGPARVYLTGDTWFEKPGAYHRVSENASDTEPARLLAVFIIDEGDKQLTIPDHE